MNTEENARKNKITRETAAEARRQWEEMKEEAYDHLRRVLDGEFEPKEGQEPESKSKTEPEGGDPLPYDPEKRVSHSAFELDEEQEISLQRHLQFFERFAAEMDDGGEE